MESPGNGGEVGGGRDCNGMEEEREDRPLQVFCCRAGNKTGELEMKNKKIAYPISRPLGFQGQSAFGY